MIESNTWLIKLILAHLLTDFILQPGTWIKERNTKHFASPRLYLHALITGAVALLLTGMQYWISALVITVTHLLIDGWKSYQADKVKYFIIDQVMHLVVIITCWMVVFSKWELVPAAWKELNEQPHSWMMITAFLFITSPAGILIGQLTKKWRDQLPEAENLANAGKWIGYVERIIILLFVLQHQYSAIGLLVAAKGIIRFNEKDRQEVKTEYLVIGTLLSIGIALVTGLVVEL